MTGAQFLIDRRFASNWLLVYGALIVLAEITLVAVDIRVGVALHAALLIGLAGHNTFSRTPKDPQVPALMLLPLLRLLSLVMPLSEWDPATWYVLTGAPSLAAVVLVSRAIGLRPAALGLRRPRAIAFDAVMVITAVPLALLLGGVAGEGIRLRGDLSPLGFLIVALPFVVVLEELLFRGLLQHLATIRSPKLALLIPNVLYAAMYLGAGGAVALAMGGIGLLFSGFVALRGSLWGVIGAHLVLRLLLQYDPFLR